MPGPGEVLGSLSGWLKLLECVFTFITLVIHRYCKLPAWVNNNFAVEKRIFGLNMNIIEGIPKIKLF